VSEQTPTQLAVGQLEFVYVATLDRPAFDFATRWVELQAALLDRLSPYHLRLADIKNESASPALADFVHAAWLLDLSSIARYRLDRIEVWSNSARLVREPGTAGALCLAALGVQEDLASSRQVVRQTVTLALHGTLTDQDPQRYVSRYVGPGPGAIPGIRAAGASFVSPLPAGEGQINWVLEHSAVVPDGIFVRTVVERQGTVSPAQAVADAIDLIQRQAAEFGLLLSWS
jgi:hypothetical protein